MHDDVPGVHKLILVVLRRHNLAHSEIILVYYLNRNVNSLSRLLELASHLVDSIDDALASLHKIFKIRTCS